MAGKVMPCVRRWRGPSSGEKEGNMLVAYYKRYMSFMILPSQQQPGMAYSPHATATTTQERSNALPSHSPHVPTTTLEGVPCPSHSSGPLSPTTTITVTTWEGFPPKRQGCQVVQQTLLVIDDPVLLGLLHRVDVAPFADNLVWLMDGDHLILLLGGW